MEEKTSQWHRRAIGSVWRLMEDAVNFDPVEIIYQAQAGQIAVHIVGEVVEMLWDGVDRRAKRTPLAG